MVQPISDIQNEFSTLREYNSVNCYNYEPQI